jgi:three-Cys-motif partner protein
MEEGSDRLFDISEFLADDGPAEPKVKTPQFPVWTENKARLIERYLVFFVYVTKHGTYIDGFAGPQEPDKPETWAANLVLGSEPCWLRHFHLFDRGEQAVQHLLDLKQSQPKADSRGRKIVREIEVYAGDFNANVHGLLDGGSIGQDEATFCLLDQRTFECQWETVQRLARYKGSGHKVELFYFLAVGWIHRAIHAQQDAEPLRKWWGGDDWQQLRATNQNELRDVFLQKFKVGLRYASVKAWPIYERKDGGCTI